MKAFKLMTALLIMVAFNIVSANGAGISAGQTSANAFAADLPVYTQTCSRSGAAFSCGNVSLLDGYSNLSQSSMSTTMLGYGCLDKSSGIFLCMPDSQFAQTTGGTVILWARNYELIGMTPATAPVYIIYLYILN
ncbi:MAG: hypothetical protein KGZ83_09515 [Sulfuricella sp.]|nr:hypothetical protein [Sulfuricella sp.]